MGFVQGMFEFSPCFGGVEGEGERGGGEIGERGEVEREKDRQRGREGEGGRAR